MDSYASELKIDEDGNLSLNVEKEIEPVKSNPYLEQIKLKSNMPTEETHWYNFKKYNSGKYYTTKLAMSEPFEYALINGGRNNGKSTAWQMEMIDEFFNNGGCSGKIVRKFTYDDFIMLNWFTPIVQEYAKDVWKHEIVVHNNAYCLVPIETEPDRYLEMKKGERVPKLNYKMFCRIFHLGLEVDQKSHDFSYITLLIMEEYTLLNHFDYLHEEIAHFQSLISTINRDRTNLRVVFIGNTISKHNPYFEWLGINVNKLKLRNGEFRRLQCKKYENGARIFVEQVPPIYKEESEIPRILKVGNNDIAISGEWTISDYVFDERFDDFISNLSFTHNATIRTNDKMYYHITCIYKNTKFNVITNRFKSLKSSGKLYEYDAKAIVRIKNGTLTKVECLKLLSEVLELETIFSDDEIEFKYQRLIGKVKY